LYFVIQRYSLGSVNSNAVLKIMGRGSPRGAARGVRGGVGGRGNITMLVITFSTFNMYGCIVETNLHISIELTSKLLQ
jgi:hypothetical protein